MIPPPPVGANGALAGTLIPPSPPDVAAPKDND